MRHATKVRWLALAALAVCVLLVLRQLPLDDTMVAVEDWIRSLGPWAPAAFVAVYLVVAMLALPGWVLTVFAGAMWGMAWGLVIVEVAAVLAVALSFLVARHGLRGRLMHRFARSPRFRALDAAITEGNWRVVALVRLTPVFPFGIQNYLYGLTGIGFWTCVVTSAVTLVPGTLLYLYIGTLTRAGVEGGGADAGPMMWVVRGLGLLAGVAAVTYVGRLARQKLREITETEGLMEAEPKGRRASAGRGRFPWGTAALASLAIVATSGTVYAHLNPAALPRLVVTLFGPPVVAAVEAFERKPHGPTFDHSGFDRVLKAVVTDDGLVDYEKLRTEHAGELDAYLAQLGSLSAEEFDALGRDEKLALFINAYNAYTLRLILDHWPVESIRDIPEDERWKADRWRVGPHTMSLDEMEHAWLRAKFVEPRIHFAIVCASVGCPPLRDEAFVGSRIDEQLDEQARIVHDPRRRWFAYDAESNTVSLPKVYEWFIGDFESVAGSRAAYAARYAPELAAALARGDEPSVDYVDWDWSLNAPRAE